ncbi:MAG: hypothetical protein HIU90_01180 [Proteobacteria bacterium]|jgi:non-homologous end joining protein Ku|nr:hypothetical protein [Pseudomonadota bacterium]
MADDAIALLRDAMADLRSEVGLLQTEVASARRDIVAIEARHMALETWRSRFEMQVETAQDRFVDKSDELVKELSRFHADLAQFRGEQSGGHRVTMIVVGLLSAVVGSIAAHVLHSLS